MGTRSRRAGLAALAAACGVLCAGAHADAASWGPSGIDYTRSNVRLIRPLPGTPVDGKAFSRDGRSVRFGAGNDLYQAAADGSHVRCITCSLQGPFDMIRQGASLWAESPGGHWLVVQRNGSAAVVGLGQVVDKSVYALRLDRSGIATAAHQLTFGPHDETDLDPIFTPDGRRVIWWQNRGISNNPADPTQWKRWKVMIADFGVGADGVPRLTNERALVDPGGAFVEDGGITGDGRTYYYTKTVGTEPEIFATDVPSGRERRVTNHVGWDEFPAPAPNGEAVGWLSDRDHLNVICGPSWLASGAAGGPSEGDFVLAIPGSIACAVGEGIPPESPDPQRNPPFHAGYANFDMYVMDSAGGRVTRVVRDWTGFFGWSPDSTQAVLQRDPTGNNTGIDVAADQIPILGFAHPTNGSPQRGGEPIQWLRAPRSVRRGRKLAISYRAGGPGRLTVTITRPGRRGTLLRRSVRVARAGRGSLRIATGGLAVGHDRLSATLSTSRVTRLTASLRVLSPARRRGARSR